MDTLVPRFIDAGVPVHLLAQYSGDPTWLLRLRRLVRNRQYSVVHSHSPYAASGARLALRTLRADARPSHVYTEHNRWSQYHRLTYWANRITYPLDDYRISVAGGVTREIADRFKKETETLVHGVDRARVQSFRKSRQDVRKELGASPNDVLVGSVGNLRPEKAHVVLLEAAARIVRKNTAVRFLLVGTGTEEQRIRAFREELNLTPDRFSLLGYRDDALRIIAALDIYVLSSDHEGFPVSVMEAQSLGLPVVATSVGGLESAVEHGVDGLLVPPRRPDLLAEAIEELIIDRSRRLRMGQQAETRSERYDATIAMRRLEQIYESLVNLP